MIPRHPPSSVRSLFVPQSVPSPSCSSPTAADTWPAQFPTTRPFISICDSTTRELCPHTLSTPPTVCTKVHFVRSLRSHTEVSLGDCSYLNTCHRMDNCRYVHWALEDPGPGDESGVGGPGEARGVNEVDEVRSRRRPTRRTREAKADAQTALLRSRCRSRHNGSTRTSAGSTSRPSASFTLWSPTLPGRSTKRCVSFPSHRKSQRRCSDISSQLPYGTLTDDEMMRMPVGSMQDEGGLLFLWVTGRAMELGRECLAAWGCVGVLCLPPATRR